MSFQTRFKSRREELGLSRSDLARKLGVTTAAIGNYETGVSTPKADILFNVFDALKCDANYLFQDDMNIRENEPERIWTTPIDKTQDDEFDIFKYKNILPVQPHRIPLLGSVAAGQPIFEPEDFDVSIPVDAPVRCDYALRVKGDSMKPTYLDGDIVLVRQQPTFDDGRIAVVAVGEEATLKHVYRTRNGVTLVSDNPDYPPMPFVEEECDEIRIMGKPVAYLRGV